MDMWFEKATKLRAGDTNTACVSCHMSVPYMLARPGLRKAMRLSDPTPQETRLLGELAQRVDAGVRQAPMYASQTAASRGTEAVLMALILARADAGTNLDQPRELTRQVFRQLWERQQADGAWDWLDFALEPNESGEARYHGATLAAIAAGTVPGQGGGNEENSARPLEKLRGYLNGKYAGQNLHHRIWMLLASTRLTGLLTREQRQGLMTEILGRQKDDGGWSLYELGPWKWSKTSAPYAPGGSPDMALLARSDGYATGLVAYALRQAGLAPNDPHLRKATDWLAANQREVRVGPHLWKCWRSHSLNHDREHGGEQGEPWKRMLMSDMATAFAVLALLPSD